MINKKEINKLIKKLARSQKGLRDHNIIHPKRDWLIGLVIAGCFLSIGASWNFITYHEIRNTDVDRYTADSVEAVSYRPAQIASALIEFKSKTDAFGEYLPTVTPEAETEVGEDERVSEDAALDSGTDPVEVVGGAIAPPTTSTTTPNNPDTADFTDDAPPPVEFSQSEQ